MHRIHVRTGYVEVPGVPPNHQRPTHDQFIIPTGENEQVVELEMFDLGYSEPGGNWTGSEFKARMKRWRFRAVSVEQVDGPLESDVVVEYDEVTESSLLGLPAAENDV